MSERASLNRLRNDQSVRSRNLGHFRLFGEQQRRKVGRRVEYACDGWEQRRVVEIFAGIAIAALISCKFNVVDNEVSKSNQSIVSGMHAKMCRI